MMTEEDKEIQEHFDWIKTMEDEQLTTPNFELPKKQMKLNKWYYLTPLAIAASLLLLFTLIPPDEIEPEASNDEMVITLSFDSEEDNTKFLEAENSISSWEAPTQLLIQEFED